MNRIDHANNAKFDPGKPELRGRGRDHASESKPGHGAKPGQSSRADGRSAPETAQPPAKTENQEAAAKMLDVIASSVMQRQVRNINVLTASVTRFMLTSLEPAMQIAQEIRARSADEPDMALETASAAGHVETLAVLAD